MRSVLEPLPHSLPALVRATRISEMAARAGFDWVRLADIRDKIAEELGELDEALEESKQCASAAVLEEFGDLLVALVNLSRHLKIDAEQALSAASAKFEQRFRHMEVLARDRKRTLESLSAAEWDELWVEAKGATRRAV